MWISVDEELPKLRRRVTAEGDSYLASDMVFVWTDDESYPIGLGCIEDGKWYVDGIVPRSTKVTHWAYIYDPEGKMLRMEYR